MKKLLIFENEFREVEPAFKAINLLYYGGQLQYEVFASSQAFGPVSNVDNYDAILVDLDLSLKSEMDGYALIRKILESRPAAKVLILSAASEEQIKIKLNEKGLPPAEIITKPVDFDDLHKLLKSVGV